jgi:hypothetical protein
MWHGCLLFVAIDDHELDHRELPSEDKTGIDSVDSRRLPRDGQSDRQTAGFSNRFDFIKFSTMRFHACDTSSVHDTTSVLALPMRQALDARLGHAALTPPINSTKWNDR